MKKVKSYARQKNPTFQNRDTFKVQQAFQARYSNLFILVHTCIEIRNPLAIFRWAEDERGSVQRKKNKIAVTL